ncbi:MAG: methyltransferase domain-containing protein [Deltaproteobacteria bacterium]|nr:methyltransferase domain-containing protein [Deltaproteobacteria bacterium]
MSHTPHSLSDTVYFMGEFIRQFRLTGSLFPTSARAAALMASPLEGREQPLRVLELGPGTGSVTSAVLARMREGDTLDICEINPRMVEVLQRRMEGLPGYQAHRARMRILVCGAQELPLGTPYDVIVCSLPFGNFDLPLVEAIFSRLRQLSHAETRMTWFEYPELKRLRLLLGGHGAPLAAVTAYLGQQGAEPIGRVYGNLPPLQAFLLKPLKGQPSAVQAA